MDNCSLFLDRGPNLLLLCVQWWNVIISAPCGNFTWLACLQDLLLFGHSIETSWAGTQNINLKLGLLYPRLILSVLVTWSGRTLGEGLGCVCVSQVIGLHVLFWIYEVVEPDTQDIRWCWNIRKDWKLNAVGTAVSAPGGESRPSALAWYGWPAWQTVQKGRRHWFQP